MDFFENRQFNKDIVDTLVKVTSDALGINIYIYWKEGDKKTRRDYILRMRSMCSDESKEVHLKFTHNNLHPQGNHYDLIVHDASIETNLDLLSTVAEYATKLPDVICIDSDDQDMPCKITTTDEPICVDVDIPQKISTQANSEHVHDPDEIPEIK